MSIVFDEVVTTLNGMFVIEKTLMVSHHLVGLTPSSINQSQIK